MKFFVYKTVLLLLCCSFYVATAQEFRSGLLLTSVKNPKKTRVIPINKKVKIWAGEENKLYRAKILAVDNYIAYLSTGQRLPIKSINSIKRKRIMFRDVGNASVVTGALAGEMLLDTAGDAVYDTYTAEDKSVGLLGGLFLSAVTVVGVGVTTLTAGTVIGIFEPRYRSEKWNIEPLNPEETVYFQNYLLNEKRRR